MAGGGTAPHRDVVRVLADRLAARGGSAFALQRAAHRARAPRRSRTPPSALAALLVTLGLSPRLRRARLGRRHVDARTAGFGQPDGDRLLRRACSVLALANVIELLANELAGL